MARDTSPIVKQSRREGYALAPKAHKIMAKKSGIPGEHSDMRVRGGSLYLTQLREKQKVRRLYGLLEKQFAKLMKEAAATSDQEKRWEMLHEAEAILMEDLPVVGIFQVGGASLVNPKVTGIEDHSAGVPYLYYNLKKAE